MKQVIISMGNYGGAEEVAAVEIENGQLTGNIFKADLHLEQNKLYFAGFLEGLFTFISNSELIVDRRNYNFEFYMRQYGLAEDCLRDHYRGMQYINDLFRTHFGHDGWVRCTNAAGLSHYFNLSSIRKVYGDSALSDAMILGISFLIMTSAK